MMAVVYEGRRYVSVIKWGAGNGGEGLGVCAAFTTEREDTYAVLYVCMCMYVFVCM